MLTCFTLCLLLRYITVRDDDDDDDVGESVRRVFSPRLAVLTLRNPPRKPKLQRFFTLNFLFFPTSFLASFRFFFFRTRNFYISFCIVKQLLSNFYLAINFSFDFIQISFEAPAHNHHLRIPSNTPRWRKNELFGNMLKNTLEMSSSNLDWSLFTSSYFSYILVLFFRWFSSTHHKALWITDISLIPPERRSHR